MWARVDLSEHISVQNCYSSDLVYIILYNKGLATNVSMTQTFLILPRKTVRCHY